MFFFTDLASFPVTTVDSSHVFQAPQAGHFPNHFGDSLPHSLQKKTVFSFAIVFAFIIASRHCEEERRSNPGNKLIFWTASFLAVTQSVFVYAAKIRK
jgi:hypothetical protein